MFLSHTIQHSILFYKYISAPIYTFSVYFSAQSMLKCSYEGVWMLMTIGNKIRYYRNLRGYTQEELGQKIGLQGDRVRQYENGIRTPKADMLKAIADALDVDVTALSDINITSEEDIMHILFELEDHYSISIEKQDGKTALIIDNEADCNTVLNTYLCYWYDKRQVFALDKITDFEDPRLEDYRSWRGRFHSNEIAFESGIIRSIDDAYRDEVEQLSKTKTKHCETISDLIRLICRISPDILLGKYNEPPIDNIYGFVFNAEKLLNPDTYSSEYAAFIYEMKNLEKLGCSTLRTISYTGSVLKIIFTIQLGGFNIVTDKVEEWLNFTRKSNTLSVLAKKEFESKFENDLKAYNEATIKEFVEIYG